MEIRFSEDVLKANEAFQMYANGERKKSIELLKHFAAKGNPNSLGTLTWYFALNGDFEKSIDFFNKYSLKMSSWIDQELKNIQETQSIDEDTIRQIKNDFEYQISNAKNNVAISFKATNNENQAIMLWREAAENHRHLESRFFLILNDNTNHLTLKKMFEDYSFTPSEIAEVITIMKATEDEAQGWFKNWIKSGLEMLKNVEEELSYVQSILSSYLLRSSHFYKFLDNHIEYSRLYKNYINDKNDRNFDILKDLAMNGFPLAFSTVILNFLFEEKYEESIIFFNKYENNMFSWLSNALEEIKDVSKYPDFVVDKFSSDYRYQITNVKNYIAVAFKAKGQDSRAIELWKESSELYSHREAKFYLLLSKDIGNIDLTQFISKHGFTIDDLTEIVNSLNSIIGEATGWFNSWASKGLYLLKSALEELSICQAISGIIESAKTQEGYFHYYILENFEIATKAATAESILKGYIKPTEQLINDLRNILEELETSLESFRSDLEDSDDEDD